MFSLAESSELNEDLRVYTVQHSRFVNSDLFVCLFFVVVFLYYSLTAITCYMLYLV